MDSLIKKIYMEDLEYDAETKSLLYGVKIQEDFKIGNFSIENYLHGRCHLFALAIHEITKIPVHLLTLPDTYFNERDTSISSGIIMSHVYLSINETLCFDAKGLDKKDNVKENYEMIESEYMFKNYVKMSVIEENNHSLEIIKSLIRKGLIADFAKNEKENIQKFFERLKTHSPLILHKEDSETYIKIEEEPKEINTNHNSIKFTR